MATTMAGSKRKDAPSGNVKDVKKQKTTTKPAAADDEFGGFSDEDGGVEVEQKDNAKAKRPAQGFTNGVQKQFKVETTSAETHAKQRALAKERKSAKPNADVIARSKQIWERLRRKSHVPKEERKELVSELFEIITGRVRDFVFKHDSVRVVQCALKYANQEQRRIIVDELKGDVRPLAESRYGKFLVAKMVTEGDADIRDKIIPEFYGHVRRLINHPEASWIVDDLYRQVATKEQKSIMLREWYGAEFSLFQRKPGANMPVAGLESETHADLVKILEKNPEKRKSILQYLLQMINALIQKKMTGFTMLHDAMLQYFLALIPGSEEHTEFIEILKGDVDAETEGGGGDLFRNLAFTKSGARLLCLAIAYSTPKNRKLILRCFKDTVEMMALDQHAKMVLVVALDVPDDTKMSAKSVLPELLGQSIESEEQKLNRLEGLVKDLNARIPTLYPLAGMAKWLVSDADKALLNEIHKIRETTSKKAHETRRKETLEYLSEPLLELVAKRTESLIESSFGCQFITETLLEANGKGRAEAAKAVAGLAASDPKDEHIANSPHASRMLKTLVSGGNFDPKTKAVKLVEPPLEFANVFYPVVKDHIIDWACGNSSFVVVALLESQDVSEGIKKEVKSALKKKKTKIQTAAAPGDGESKGNAGAKILLEKIT